MIKKILPAALILALILSIFTALPTGAASEEVTIVLPGNERVTVNVNEEFDLIFYTAGLLPVTTLKGHIQLDVYEKIEVVESELCFSSVEDGALLEGSLRKAWGSSYEFDVHATPGDLERFAGLRQGDSAYAKYVIPVIRLRVKAVERGRRYDLGYAFTDQVRDISGRLVYDWDVWFNSTDFECGLMILRDEPAEPLRGDADGDGEITILDATRIQRRLADLVDDSGIDMDAADADADGEVTILDATRIQRFLAGLYVPDSGTSPEPEPTEPTEPTEPPVEPDKPTVPRINKVESSNAGVVIQWDAIEGAEAYRVFMKNGSSWKKLGDTASTSFTHTDAPYGTQCVYTVRCVTADGATFTSDFDHTGYANTRLTVPKLKSATLMDCYVGVGWEKVEGAQAYRVYIKGGAFASWTAVCNTDYNYVDLDTALLGLENGVKYSFTVRCLDALKDGRLTSGHNTTGVSVAYYDTPYLYGIVNTVDGIELYWTAVEGAAKYRVFEWVDGGWKKITDTEDTAVLITGFNPNTTYLSYRFTVRGLDKNGAFLTPYDPYGRMMYWDPSAISKTGTYKISHVVDDIGYYAKDLGFTLDKNADVDEQSTAYCMMDCTGFYYGNDWQLEALLVDRCMAMVDYYVRMLRRCGEDPADYACYVSAEADEEDNIWLYFVYGRLTDR